MRLALMFGLGDNPVLVRPREEGNFAPLSRFPNSAAIDNQRNIGGHRPPLQFSIDIKWQKAILGFKSPMYQGIVNYPARLRRLTTAAAALVAAVAVIVTPAVAGTGMPCEKLA